MPQAPAGPRARQYLIIAGCFVFGGAIGLAAYYGMLSFALRLQLRGILLAVFVAGQIGRASCRERV